MGFISGFIYFAPFFITAAVVYALWRNQREAVESPLVDRTNFLPRLASIVEVVLHPGRAATWSRPATKKEVEIIEAFDNAVVGTVPKPSFTYMAHWDVDGTLLGYWVPVFPNLGKDSSEVHGIRLDDKVSS